MFLFVFLCFSRSLLCVGTAAAAPPLLFTVRWSIIGHATKGLLWDMDQQKCIRWDVVPTLTRGWGGAAAAAAAGGS